MMERDTKMRQAEIVGIGACVMDTLITVSKYPKEDTKVRALSYKLAGGGPAATGIVTASCLGVPSGFIGVLAQDNTGIFLKKDFVRYGVDVSYIEMKGGYRGFSSTVWLSKNNATRTCVFDRGDLPPLELDEKKKALIAGSSILLIDGNEMGAAQEACLVAKKSGTKVLYDCGGMYEGVENLLGLTSVMIPSEEFALGHTGCKTVKESATKLFEMYRPEVTIVTCGKKGGIMYDGKELTEYPAFKVDAIDTNGSGDVFHGAFAAAMIKGFSYQSCCVYASAVSAIKCTGYGARESLPDENEVYSFLESRGVRL